jgi:intracellular multiplication protein IcmK
MKRVRLQITAWLLISGVGSVYAAQAGQPLTPLQLQQLEQLKQLTSSSATAPAATRAPAPTPAPAPQAAPSPTSTMPSAPAAESALFPTSAAPDTATTASNPQANVPDGPPSPEMEAAYMRQYANANPPGSEAAPTATAEPAPAASAPLGGIPNVVNEPGISPTDQDKVMAEQAFQQLAQQRMPMTPEQIIRLRQLYNQTEQAAVTQPGTPPRPVATSQLVSLAPGTTPPVIRLAQGFVSSLVFLDSTGAPWPILAYDLGNPAAFNIQWDQKSNTMMIQASKQYTYGNMAVRLQNLNTPVMLTLVPGQKAVDYRVDLRIQGIGPMAKALPTESGLPGSADPLLLQILDGVPPPGSQLLSVLGGKAMAWSTKEAIFLRTELTLLSPGWIASMKSADGMHAYKLQKTPLLLVSDHGKVVQLKLEGL